MLSMMTVQQKQTSEKNLRLILQQNLQNESAQTQTQSAQRYKTELCRSFQENGTCKYGEKCQFSHGMHELRSMMRHPKYKSELCRTFHAQGYCPYGPRCHFVHEIQKNDIKKTELTQKCWINTKNQNISWPAQYHSAPGSKSVSPKPESGLLMCSNNFSSSNNSLFSHISSDFHNWENFSGSNSNYSSKISDCGSSGSSSTHEVSPTSSRSLSPDHQNFLRDDDVDFSTTMLVNQILNNINSESQYLTYAF
jgi:hypothetical protein